MKILEYRFGCSQMHGDISDEVNLCLLLHIETKII